MRVEVAYVLAVAVAVAACGPGLGHPATASEATRSTLLDVTGDAGALEAMMRESVIDGGILFSDAACARDFGSPRTIPQAQFHAFAHCLATLHLQAGEREDAFADVAIVSYMPGVELEVRLKPEWEGRRMIWIGFAGRFDPADATPTITPALLESLREAGTMHPSAEGLAADSYAWLRFCMDADGNPRSVTPIEATSKKASRAMEVEAGTWKFKPSPVGAACATVAVGHPRPNLTFPLSPNPDHSIRLPISAFHRKSGDKNIVPDDDTKTAMSRAKRPGSDRWLGTFKLCINGDGSIASVDKIRSTGSPGYDRRIERTIKETWTFEPLDGGDAACTAVTFIYSQR